MSKKSHWLVLVCLAPGAAYAAGQGDLACFNQLATYAIERPRIPGSWMERPQFDVSQDGRALVYVERSANVSDNSVTDKLWTVDLMGGGGRTLVSELERRRDDGNLRPANPSFSPDGKLVAVLGGRPATGVTIFNLAAKTSRSLGLKDSTITDLKWAPDGKALAVSIMTAQARFLRNAYQPSSMWDGSSQVTVRHRLAILDIASGAITDETPIAYDLMGMDAAFSWAPGGKKIAFSAENIKGGSANIYMWDLSNHDIRPIIDRAGPNLDPRWSPDGSRVAYLTADGRDPMAEGLQLVIQSASGPDRLVVPRPDGMTGTPYLPTWVDSGHLAYVAMRQMECPVFSVDVSRSKTEILGRQSLSCFGGIRIGAHQTLFMTRHNFENPGEVVVTAGKTWAPKSLIQPSDKRSPPWRAESVSWRSRQGDFLINGVLIRARGQTADRGLLISIPGGPAMVTPDSYNDDAPFLPYGPLLDGFSILIPNTRGRGGYGRDFEAAIRSGKDYVEGPLEDILGGVDYATERLRTPRSRVALAGFSYGGILTAYAASKSHAFRAAMSMEGVVDFYSRALLEYGGPNQQVANANMGFGNPYDVDEKARLLSQSPLASVDGLQTPVLLECGEKSLGPTDCLKFFRTGNARGSARVELAIYPRTAHQILEPALRFDSAKRQLEWLRKWIPAPASGGTTSSCYKLQ